MVQRLETAQVAVALLAVHTSAGQDRPPWGTRWPAAVRPRTVCTLSVRGTSGLWGQRGGWAWPGCAEKASWGERSFSDRQRGEWDPPGCSDVADSGPHTARTTFLENVRSELETRVTPLSRQSVPEAQRSLQRVAIPEKQSTW